MATIAGNTPNDGSFLWTVPRDKAAANDYRIRVTSLTFGVSDFGGYFTTSNLPSALTVTSPAAGVNWPKNTTQTITWTSQNVPTSANRKIELYKGGVFVDPIVASTPNDGSYSWAIANDPTWTPGNNYQVKVSNLAGTVSDFSGLFTLSDPPPPPGSITVIAPNGGQNWKRGLTYDVKWSSQYVGGTVKIELLKGGSSQATIKSSIATSAGVYSWKIPNDPGTYPSASDYKIRICNPSESVCDSSDAKFTISGAL